jgi:hypothetical protein
MKTANKSLWLARCLILIIGFLIIGLYRLFRTYIMHPIHFFIIFGAILMAIGLFLSIQYRRNMEKAKASRFWPSVEGEVISSQITHLDEDGADEYRPNIVYHYKVESREYEGHAAAFGMEGAAFRRRDSAERAQRPYPVGARVLVHYDPSNPSVSTIEAGNTGWALQNRSLGLVIALAGLASICFGLYETWDLFGIGWTWFNKPLFIAIALIAAALLCWTLYERHR